MKKMTPLVSLLIALTALLILSSSALATYYQYVDDSGNVVMTNDRKKVPAKYRAHMKVTKDEYDAAAPKNPVPQTDPPEVAAPAAAQAPAAASAPTAAPAPSPAAAPAAPAAEVPEGRFAQLCAQHPWLKPVVYVFGLLASFLVVVKLASLLPSPQMAKVIYLVFFVSVGLFLYKTYVEHLVQGVHEVKTQTIQMMEKANKRREPVDPAGDLVKGVSDSATTENKPN